MTETQNNAETDTGTGAFSPIRRSLRRCDCRCGVCAAYKTVQAFLDQLDDQRENAIKRIFALLEKPCVASCWTCLKRRQM